MIMEYTDEENCNEHVKSHYIILVDVVQTLMCFGDRSSVSVGREFYQLRDRRMHTVQGLYGHQ
jgi:hypothetical protein